MPDDEIQLGTWRVRLGAVDPRMPGGKVESTYDWEHKQRTVPLNVAYSRVLRVGKQMVSFQGGVGRYLEAPTLAADWGVRFTTTLMFPKR